MRSQKSQRHSADLNVHFMLDTLRTQIAFRVLFSNYAKKDTMCEVVGSTSNEEDGLDVFADPSYGLCDDVKSGFDSLQRSLMTTFIAGFLGDFDIGVMDDYELFMARDGTEGNYYYVQPYLAWFFFGTFMMLVAVVALNALIAFMGETFTVVNGRKKEELIRQKAGLLIEVLALLDKDEREKDEREMKWIHCVAPVAQVTHGCGCRAVPLLCAETSVTVAVLLAGTG